MFMCKVTNRHKFLSLANVTSNVVKIKFLTFFMISVEQSRVCQIWEKWVIFVNFGLAPQRAMIGNSEWVRAKNIPLTTNYLNIRF